MWVACVVAPSWVRWNPNKRFNKPLESLWADSRGSVCFLVTKFLFLFRVHKPICILGLYAIIRSQHLFLVVKVHFTVGHLPTQPVHILAELQSIFSLIRGLIQLLGQVEVLTVKLCILLSQCCQLLLQVCDHLQSKGNIHISHLNG